MKERILDEAVQGVTGKTWREWVRTLNEAEIEPWSHKTLAAYLREKYQLRPWWCQMVATTYEQKTGRRVVGQTSSVGFAIGVRKTIPLSKEQAWELITSPQGIKSWLGEISAYQLTVGQKYETSTGILETPRSEYVFPNSRLMKAAMISSVQL